MEVFKRDVTRIYARRSDSVRNRSSLQREAEHTSTTRQKPHHWQSIPRLSKELAPRGLESREVEAKVSFQLP
jgi:hypothetical protein